MRYGSVCSGIEAASAAWHPLGWQAEFFSEIEPFPRSVLAHHYPDVPNYGDMTQHAQWPRHEIDVLVGGTPCQSFSVAGLRGGLSDERGNLALTFIRIADQYAPQYVLWENVPGVLSSRDNAFGCFLAGLCGADCAIVPGGRWSDAGVVAGPKRTAAWRVLDAQFFGVAQRRRRVFVLAVAGAGNWRSAAALFPIAESVRWHSAPSREAGEKVAPTIAGCANGGGANGPGRDVDSVESLIAPTIPSRSTAGGGLGTDFDCDGGLIAPQVSPALKARDYKGPSSDGDGDGAPLIAHALRAEDHDASEDGTGRGTPIVPVSVALRGRDGGATAEMGDDVAFSLRASTGGGDKPHVMAHAFDARQANVLQYGDQSGPLDTDGHSVAVAWPMHGGMIGRKLHNGPGGRGFGDASDPSYTITASGMVKHGVVTPLQVRRLTPRECERLQGFPDDYTLVAHRGKPAADGPRYKALGNSMAVPVMRWIGRRIELVERMWEAQ